jgi:hypothetical protein
MPSLVAALASILTLALTGCAPLPYVRTSKPEISGILLQNGVPVPGVLITSCGKGQLSGRCERIKKSMTDSQGQFFFGAEWEFDKLIPYIGDQKFNYDLNFQYLDRVYLWNGGGVGDTPKSVNLRCEMGNNVLCTVEVTGS